jgi:predicted DNA-binding transcriptional regulator AlpA
MQRNSIYGLGQKLSATQPTKTGVGLVIFVDIEVENNVFSNTNMLFSII